MAKMSCLDSLRRASGIKDYGAWSAMPDGWIIVFVGLFGLMASLSGVLLATVRPDAMAISRMLTLQVFCQLSNHPDVLLELACVGIALVGTWALGFWGTVMTKELLGIIHNRHFGKPAA